MEVWNPKTRYQIKELHYLPLSVRCFRDSLGALLERGSSAHDDIEVEGLVLAPAGVRSHRARRTEDGVRVGPPPEKAAVRASLSDQNTLKNTRKYPQHPFTD